MTDSAPPCRLPSWAQVSERRRAHIERVTAVLEQWAVQMNVPADERQAWRDAGCWHDALRDAPIEHLKSLTQHAPLPETVLHGPAAAAQLRLDGERRDDVLLAIQWHTLGNPDWSRTGQALFMADFLEPGRSFMVRDRAFMAERVPDDFEGVFRQVVRMRLEWTLREGKKIFRETVALWNRVR